MLKLYILYTYIGLLSDDLFHSYLIFKYSTYHHSSSFCGHPVDTTYTLVGFLKIDNLCRGGRGSRKIINPICHHVSVKFHTYDFRVKAISLKEWGLSFSTRLNKNRPFLPPDKKKSYSLPPFNFFSWSLHNALRPPIYSFLYILPPYHCFFSPKSTFYGNNISGWKYKFPSYYKKLRFTKYIQIHVYKKNGPYTFFAY